MSRYRSAAMPQLRVQINCSEGGRTRQSEKDACDVNKIIKRFVKTGVIEHLNRRIPAYGDLTALSLQDALNLQIEATESFMALPAAVRKRFGHEPLAFLSFVEDPANADEMVELGLATKKVQAEKPVDKSEAPPKAEGHS